MVDAIPPRRLPFLLDKEGRFEAVSELGAGGMARVYLVHDRTLRVDRAVKVIQGAGRAAAIRSRRIQNEARAMARVHHPHILGIHDMIETEEGLAIVMDFIRGGTMDNPIEIPTRPVPPHIATRWMCQVLDALGAAHDAGIVHRDVKPSNVLINEAGDALLADFGIAVFIDDHYDRMTRTGAAMGSVVYMAPEQRIDAREVRPQADIYAAAASLFSVVTATTPIDLFTAQPDSPRWAGLPEPLFEPLFKATRLDPQHRHVSAGAFRADLLAALELLTRQEGFRRVELGAGPTASLPTLAGPTTLTAQEQTGLTFEQDRGSWARVSALAFAAIGVVASLVTVPRLTSAPVVDAPDEVVANEAQPAPPPAEVPAAPTAPSPAPPSVGEVKATTPPAPTKAAAVVAPTAAPAAPAAAPASAAAPAAPGTGMIAVAKRGGGGPPAGWDVPISGGSAAAGRWKGQWGATTKEIWLTLDGPDNALKGTLAVREVVGGQAGAYDMRNVTATFNPTTRVLSVTDASQKPYHVDFSFKLSGDRADGRFTVRERGVVPDGVEAGTSWVRRWQDG